jgi:glutathione S-transferase
MPDQAPSPDRTAGEPASRPWKERTATALRRRLALLQEEPEAGMSTAEYAVGTVAACAFAAVLYRVVTGDSVVDGLTDLVDRALATLA